MAEERQIQGWREVQIRPNMPLDAIVHFANILNQRLVTIEDILKVDGKTLTQIYAEQAEQERAEMAKRMTEQTEKKGE